MRRILFLVGLIMQGSGFTSERMLNKLEPIDYMLVVCGCSFNETIPGANEGSYGSGPELLLLNPNGKPPHALVNLGLGNIKLLPSQPIEFPLYECKAGAIFSTAWSTQQVEISVNLTAIEPGAEACWFKGSLVAKQSGESWYVPIKGACGC